MIYLSYFLSNTTPAYRGGVSPSIEVLSSIKKGSSSNGLKINSPLHVGTHIDFPNHAYTDGAVLNDYDADFFRFSKVLFIESDFSEVVIEDELIDILENIEDIGYEMLLVKTGMCNIRGSQKYWSEAKGFGAKVHTYLRKKFPNIRVFGFDTISLTSYEFREDGRVAHKAFLNPKEPILLIEDMDLG